MSLNNSYVFEVDKKELHKTRIADMHIESELAENELILSIDKFALTANNITYGMAGDSLGYWRFFPRQALNEESGSQGSNEANKEGKDVWGRLPVMGYADVIASNSDDVKVGERVWGFFPMASHVKILAGHVTSMSFSDVSPHRKGLSPLYAVFDRVIKNPFYQVENEDYEILLRGLFTTAWLIDDFMFDHDYYGAEQYLITSVSSKTSIALAFTIRARGERPSIGLTSEANRAFVESLGCYEQVITYDEVQNLNASTPSILVDMAGSAKTLHNVHHHFQEQLRYSCRIGATHRDNLVTTEKLPGAVPTFFFAPTQLKKRTVDWGTGEMMKQMNAGLLNYIEFCRTTITINHTTDKNQIDGIYQTVLSGKADAAVGQIISLR